MRRAALLLAAGALACGAQFPEPARGAHPPNDAVAVPFPPPPAKVEEVPPQPGPECVWIDGYWEFGESWEWQSGEWLSPTVACRLAPAELRRERGVLLYAKPRFYPIDQTLLGPQSACVRPPVCRSELSPAAPAEPAVDLPADH